MQCTGKRLTKATKTDLENVTLDLIKQWINSSVYKTGRVTTNYINARKRILSHKAEYKKLQNYDEKREKIKKSINLSFRFF